MYSPLYVQGDRLRRPEQEEEEQEQEGGVNFYHKISQLPKRS